MIVGIVAATLIIGTVIGLFACWIRRKTKRQGRQQRLSAALTDLGMRFDEKQPPAFPPPMRSQDSYASAQNAQLVMGERGHMAQPTLAELMPPPLPTKEAVTYPPSSPALSPMTWHSDTSPRTPHPHSFYLAPESRPVSAAYEHNSLLASPVPSPLTPAVSLPTLATLPPPSPLHNPFDREDDEPQSHPGHRIEERPISDASGVYGGLLDSMLEPELAGPRPAFAQSARPDSLPTSVTASSDIR